MMQCRLAACIAPSAPQIMSILVMMKLITRKPSDARKNPNRLIFHDRVACCPGVQSMLCLRCPLSSFRHMKSLSSLIVAFSLLSVLPQGVLAGDDESSNTDSNSCPMQVSEMRQLALARLADSALAPCVHKSQTLSLFTTNGELCSH